MAERIYTSNRAGELVPLEEERFADEDTLQRLIAEHPELLDGVPRQLEMPVTSISFAGSPPLAGGVAGPRRCGSWGRQTLG